MRFLIMRFSSQTRFNKELYEISAVLNYAIVQQLAFFAFVCITQLFLALRYSHTSLLLTTPTSHTHTFHPLSTIIVIIIDSSILLTCAKFKVWMTIVESGWNVWVWLVGVVSRRRVWLVGVGGIYGCDYWVWL